MGKKRQLKQYEELRIGGEEKPQAVTGFPAGTWVEEVEPNVHVAVDPPKKKAPAKKASTKKTTTKKK